MSRHARGSSSGISRRGFIDGLGGSAALGSVALQAVSAAPVSGLPPGAALRVRPVLTWQLQQRKERTSWRAYGGIVTREQVDREAARIVEELKVFAAKATFPIEIQPTLLVNSPAEAAAARDSDTDVHLIYASGGPVEWLETIVNSQKPAVMFLRHNSGPMYFYYETAHFRFLRRSEDDFRQQFMDVDDVVVDDYGDVLWRLRALYGLKNAKGTKSLAIGGLRSYSTQGQRFGPPHVRGVWNYELIPVADQEVERRVAKARADQDVMREVIRQTEDYLAQPNLTLATEKKFVVNSFLALRVFKELMRETGSTNVGVANCMGSLIRSLDTPPCLVLSLLNDEGYTAFCHTDYTHTPPGVLLRWISGKPSFVCNSHYPHHGLVTLAHCSTPRRMNGVDFEPTKIVTHFESDYGAATRVEFRRGQVVTAILPNFTCTKWMGLRGSIAAVPDFPACRSQMEVRIDGDWRRFLSDMQGFHTVVSYGDHLREVGYALKKVGVAWENVSPPPETRPATPALSG